MKVDDRKAAVRAHKERKIEAGIYAVRCSASNGIWVGRAPDLSTIQNRLWFTLRHGINAHPMLVQDWREYGEEAFAFEIVERLKDDDMAYARDRVLKERLAHWVEALGAIEI